MSPRQFDVFRNPSAKGSAGRPFVIVLQSEILSHLSGRLVAPLAASGLFQAIPRLHPQFEVEGQLVHLYPSELAVFPSQELRERVTNLREARDVIIAALDLVFTGI